MKPIWEQALVKPHQCWWNQGIIKSLFPQKQTQTYTFSEPWYCTVIVQGFLFFIFSTGWSSVTLYYLFCKTDHFNL